MNTDHNILAIELAAGLMRGDTINAADRVMALPKADAVAVTALTMHEAGKKGPAGRERARAFANTLYVMVNTYQEACA